ncbi:hypothetical protein ACIPF8_22965 [Collimonas sp. NPDC087041]|uniref:hypothetical protein n=1 Tax=Collimonas sp. NPDC087041 TaxID=3363960 RepID=UPI003815FEAB
MKPTNTAQDIQAMVNHWLNTPPNGDLGSDYGADPQSLLQNPVAAGIGDAFIGKMREDVPALDVMPVGAVNVFYVDALPDRSELIVDVAGWQEHVSWHGLYQGRL